MSRNMSRQVDVPSTNADLQAGLSRALSASRSISGTNVLASIKAPSSRKRQECTVSRSVSKHVKMQCNQQPTHQTHRSTKITINKRFQNVHKIKEQLHCANRQRSTMRQQLYNSAKIPNKICKDLTQLEISQYIITLQTLSFFMLFHFFKTCLFHASSKTVDPPNTLSQAL